MKKNDTFTTFGMPTREIVPRQGCYEAQSVRGETLRCLWHYHREFEFTGIAAGRGRLLIGGVWGDFGPGHLALFGGFLPHYYASARSENHFRSSVLKFRWDSLGGGFFQLPEAEELLVMLRQARLGVVFEDAAELVEELETLAAEDEPLRQLSGFVRFLTRAAALERRTVLADPVDADNLPNSRDEKRLSQGLTYLHKNFRRPGVALADAATAAGMRPELFGRLFRKYMGSSFSGHLAQLRIDNAVRMLLESSLPVSEIALESGFANLANFNRLFLKLRRLTPRECRKNGGATGDFL